MAARMNHRISPRRLDYEKDRRGLTDLQLAELSHVSTRTLGWIRQGRPVSVDTLHRLGQVFDTVPVIPGIDALLDPPDQVPVA